MTDNTLPEVGSRWTMKDGLPGEIAAVKKRGRGYYVEVVGTVPDETGETCLDWKERLRLADFRKQAKPA